MHVYKMQAKIINMVNFKLSDNKWWSMNAISKF